MKINFSRGVGRKVMAYALVGTMVTGVVVASEEKFANIGDENKSYLASDIANGFYYDEDVKRNRQELMDRIQFGGSEKAKTYGKTKINSVSVKKI